MIGAEKQTSGISPLEIFRALFRFKWLLICGLVLSLAAGASTYFLYKPTYRSTAKLLVRYVMDAKLQIGRAHV